jgi:hypothetical protein
MPRGTEARGGLPTTAVLLVAAGALLRLLGARGDLWLDEVWSVELVKQVTTPLGILTDIHRDNNHALNSLWIYLVGPGASSFAYRALAVAASVATLVLVWIEGRRAGRAAGTIALLLAGVSYPLVLWGSEARGYATAVMGALAAWTSLRRYASEGRPWQLVGFWAAMAVALLSQLSVVEVYGAFLLWSVARGRAHPFRHLALHVVPLGLLVVLWLVDVRYMEIGGGPTFALWDVVRDALAVAMGAPWDVDAAKLAAVAAAVAMCAAGVAHLWRRGDPEWLLYLAVLVVAPGFVLVVWRPTLLYLRYFVVELPFLYLLAGRLLADWWTRGRAAQAAVAAGLALVVGGHLFEDAWLVREGRGHYCDAVRFMGDHTQGDDVVVGSDHDFRNMMVLAYYASCLPAGKRLLYATMGRPSEWRVHHSGYPPTDAPSEIVIMSTRLRYRVVQTFPVRGLSGYTWFIYHRE